MRRHDEQPKHVKKRAGAPAVVFFLLLAVLTVVAFILPLRPTRSYSEKRELTRFPEFSAAALLVLCGCATTPFAPVAVPNNSTVYQRMEGPRPDPVKIQAELAELQQMTDPIAFVEKTLDQYKGLSLDLVREAFGEVREEMERERNN